MSLASCITWFAFVTQRPLCSDPGLQLHRIVCVSVIYGPNGVTHSTYFFYLFISCLQVTTHGDFQPPFWTSSVAFGKRLWERRSFSKQAIDKHILRSISHSIKMLPWEAGGLILLRKVYFQAKITPDILSRAWTCRRRASLWLLVGMEP